MKIRSLSGKNFLILLLVMVFLVGLVFTASSQTTVLGDVNNSSKIDIIDALLVAQYSAGLPTSLNLAAAEVNCDGTVSINDALIIARYSANLLSTIICNPKPTPTATCACTVIVNGYVTDAITDAALSGVIVEMYYHGMSGPYIVTTNTNGYYNINAFICLVGAPISIQAKKTGYAAFTRSTNVTCSQTLTLPIRLNPEAVTPTPTPQVTPTPTPLPCTTCEMVINGKVTIAGAGQPLAGATIDFYTGPSNGVTTDENGNYTLKLIGVQPGGSCPWADFMLVARASGYSDKISGIIGFTCSYNYPQDFSLTPLVTTAPVH